MSEQVTYRRAKTWHIALSQMTGILQMMFYVLTISYAIYIANLGFGVTMALAGVLATVSRVFDSVTDPIIAVIIERFNSKHGKLRFFLLLGWFLMSLSTILLCNLIGGKFSFAADQTTSNVLGVIAFTLLFFLFYIGYTFASCTANMTGNILTNDPKQRPMLGVWGTIYSYLAPMIGMAIITTMLLPKYGIANVTAAGATDYDWTMAVFSHASYIMIGISFVALVLCCIGLTPYDKPENFVGLNRNSTPSLKEMAALLKENKELGRYIVAASSDKLAQSVGGQSVISTMLFGIILGSMVGSSIVSLIAMLPSIIFAIIGAKMAGRQGNKKVMVDWTWICILWNVVFAAFIILVPGKSAGSIGIPLILFFLLMLGNNALKMVVSTATSAMRMDVVDYELYRSGNYLPATVSAVYSFIDKLISALAPMLATLLIGFIGYTGSRIPQASDPLTMGVRIATAVLFCGFPIIGWFCTLLSMKKFSLTKERMEEIQISIAEKKAEAKDGE
ncbi:MAG: MFS transporter [Lachnospiraceae bacterium]|nr:MFS transporter [Lachnospiraceae bacterium]